MTKKKSISSSYDEEQYEEIRLYAYKKGMSPSAFVKMTAFNYMTKYPRKLRGTPKTRSG